MPTRRPPSSFMRRTRWAMDRHCTRSSESPRTAPSENYCRPRTPCSLFPAMRSTMTDTPKHHRQQDLLAYVQDFLEPAERRELEEHMRGCADCQKTLEEVRAFLPALQKALTPEEISSAEMLARVKAQMRASAPRKEPFFTRMRIALTVGGAAVATTVLIVLQPLLQQGETGAAAKKEQPKSGYGAAPRRAEEPLDAGPDAGLTPDGGITP